MRRVSVVILVVLFLAAAYTTLQAQEEKPVIQQLLVNAEYWKREGQPDKAIEIYEKVLVSDPRNATALAELALIYTERGDTAQANTYLKRLETHHPRHPRIQEIRGTLTHGPKFGQSVDEARDLVKRGQTDQGLTKYREAFEGREPDGPVALEYYQTMGGIEGRWEEARIGLEKLASRYPDNPRFQMALAKHLTYREATRREGIERLERLRAVTSQAVEADAAQRQALLWLRAAPGDQRLLQAYLDRHPDDTEVQEKLAGIQAQPAAPAWQRDLETAYQKLEEDNLDEAETLFNQVLVRNPGNISAKQGLAVIAMRRDDLPRAKQLLEEIREARPQTPALWKTMLDDVDFWLTMRRGDAALADGDDALAEQHYREASGYAVEPVYHAHLALARIHEGRGELAAAETEYLQVLAAQPEHRETLRALVALYLRMDRRDEAERMNQRLGALAPETAYSTASIRAESLRVAAAQRRRIGDAEGTLSLLEEARRTDPRHVRALYDLAEVLLELRRFPESWLVLAELKQAVEGRDDSEMIQAELLEARLLMDDQRYQEAHDLVSRIAQRRASADVLRLKRTIEVVWQVHRVTAAYREPGRSGEAYTEMVNLQLAVGDSPELMATVALGWQQMGESKRAMSLMLTAHELTEKERPGVRLPYASLLLEQDETEAFETTVEEIRMSPVLSLRQRLDLANLRVAQAIRMSDRERLSRRYREALDALNQVRRDYPNDPRIHNAVGRIYLSAERYEAAERAYRKALELDPSDLDARRGLVEALRLQGKNSEAADVLRVGLALHRDDYRMHLQAGQVEASQGNDREAMGHYRRARELEQAQRRSEGGDSLPVEEGGAIRDPDPIEAGMLAVEGRHGSGIQPSLFARYRTGESGFGQLTHVYAPIKTHVATGYVGRFELRVTPVYVDAGRADLSSPLVGQRYGSIGALGLNVQGGVHPSEGGVELEAGWRYQLFRLYVGSSPLGFPIMNVLGGAEAGFTHRGFGLNVHLRRHTIKDSVLSYAGVRDPVTDRHWGGVTGNGGRLDLTYATPEMLVYAFGGYDFLYGEDVAGNHNWFSGLGLRWTVHDDPRNTWKIGAALNALGYSDNRRYFTLGHGGYFSPQVFINGGVPIFWSGVIGPLRYEMNATVGANWFREDGSDYYPGDTDLQRLRAALTDTLTGEPLQSRYPWRTSLSFAVSGGASLSYELTEQFCVGMAAWGSLGHHYSEVYGGLMLGYSFTRGSRIVLPTSLEIAP